MGALISSLLFQPPASPTALPHDVRLLHLPCTLADGSSGDIAAAFFAHRSASFTILFSHGNAEDLGTLCDWMQELSENLQANVLAYDYVGYGFSCSPAQADGKPTELNCYRSAEAALAYLVNRRGIAAESIVLWGRSLGTAMACYLATSTNAAFRGLVMQSPLLSAYRIAFPFRFSLVGDSFRCVDMAARLRVHVLLVHGTRDAIVPVWHSYALLRLIPHALLEEPLFVEGAGHNNVEATLEQLARRKGRGAQSRLFLAVKHLVGSH